MKQFFLPILTLVGAFYLAAPRVMAQVSASDVMNIALKGDANTEQSAKLELIRILEERLNKLTVAQLNSRILVSSGVRSYYKVDEILTMNKQIYGLRSKYVVMANNLEKGNPGFSATSGNGFSWAYIRRYNEILGKAQAIEDQLKMLLKDGKPIQLPAMPTFSISPATSGDDIASSFTDRMKSIMDQYGIKEQGDVDKLSDSQKAAFQAAVDAAKADFEKQMTATLNATTKQSLTLLGNIAGTLLGVPGAGSLIAGVASGNASSAISGLVGSIVDKFAVPDDYYDSQTLKLTDAERLKIIDELHLRISEMYQQVVALGANMSSESKTRYNELAQPRNEMIMRGPK